MNDLIFLKFFDTINEKYDSFKPVLNKIQHNIETTDKAKNVTLYDTILFLYDTVFSDSLYDTEGDLLQFHPFLADFFNKRGGNDTFYTGTISIQFFEGIGQKLYKLKNDIHYSYKFTDIPDINETIQALYYDIEKLCMILTRLDSVVIAKQFETLSQKVNLRYETAINTVLNELLQGFNHILKQYLHTENKLNQVYIVAMTMLLYAIADYNE